MAVWRFNTSPELTVNLIGYLSVALTAYLSPEPNATDPFLFSKIPTLLLPVCLVFLFSGICAVNLFLFVTACSVHRPLMW